MKRLACAITLLVAAGPGLAAADPDEPLASVKQELKVLQADSAAQKNGSVDPKLKSALPSIVLVSPGAGAADQPNFVRQSEQDRKKQKDTRKNWLIEQYDLLDPKNAQTKTGDGPKLPDESLEPKSDHDQLMDRLEENDPHGRQADAESKKHQRPETLRAPDPFAPFMRDWLANSPASGPMFDTFSKTANSQPSEVLLPGMDARAPDASITTRISVDPARPDSRGAQAGTFNPAPNPYFPGLEMVFQREGMPSATALSSPVADALLQPNVTPARDSLLRPAADLEPGKRNSPESPASKLAEDKKYFPQQKRF